MYRTVRLLPALLVLALLLPACDSLDDVGIVVNLADEPVALSGSQGSVPVQANQATLAQSTVTNDLEIDRVEELKEIELRPEFFTFTPSAAAGKGGGVQGSGTITVVVLFNNVPLPQAVTVTVANDVVTQVQPAKIVLAGLVIDRDAILSVLNALPPGQRPNLQDWQNMTLDQIVAQINAGLSAASFPFGVAIRTTGDLSGTLRLSQFTLDASVRLD